MLGTMMSFEDLVERLRAAPHGELRRIEREAGINYGTIREIKDGLTKNPRIQTFNSLVDWCEKNPLPTGGAMSEGCRV